MSNVEINSFEPNKKITIVPAILFLICGGLILLTYLRNPPSLGIFFWGLILIPPFFISTFLYLLITGLSSIKLKRSHKALVFLDSFIITLLILFFTLD